MKILHVVHGYYPALGGSEWLMQCVSENLVKRYTDTVNVYTANGYNAEAFVDPRQPLLPAETFTLNDVTVRRFKVFNRLGPLLYRLQGWSYNLGLPFSQYFRTWYGGPIMPGLRRAVAQHEADVVCAMAFPLLHMYTVQNGCEQSHKPLVYVGALHPLDDWGYGRSMIYEAIHRAAGYVALSGYEKAYLVETWGIAPEKIAVIGVGIDVEPYVQADGAIIRERYNIGERPLVGFIGQQGWRKGLDALVLGMKIVWQIFPEARLLISGAPTQYTPSIKRIIAEYLSPVERARIIYLGRFTEAEKPHLFAACDVFAYPSRYESFGIAFIEAWAAGRPVVGCRAGAVQTVVSDGVDGMLVPVGDAVVLGTALVKLLSSPTLRQQMGAAGHEKVLRNYTWDVVTRRWRAVYERVII